ncbi:MAG: dehydrogenase, partial [Saprospiraceae bacterium]|nr:dehydrogenase [Saprospiraceae bacterium]
PFHSQSTEGWFVHTPGLKIVYPSNPYDAKGLLLASFQDPNPVLFFEHKKLYRSLTEPVPDQAYTVPIGKANLVQEGTSHSIITYGLGVHWATQALAELSLEADILDLRSLAPLDYDAIAETVIKTGRVIILHEANKIGGPGAEIAAYISEHLFEYLDAPVIRCASLDTPVPFAANLEEQFLPKSRLKEALNRLLEY